MFAGRPPLLAPAATGLAAVGALVGTYLFSPGSGPFTILRCPLYSVTGIYCPGCGATRALHSLTHGDLGAAIQNNIMLMLFLPVFIYAWVWWMGERSGKWAWPRYRLAGKPGVALCLLIAAFWIARNVGVDWLVPITA